MGKAVSKFIGLNRIKANLLNAHAAAMVTFNTALAGGLTIQEAATLAMENLRNKRPPQPAP
jgi:hypothetical protein